MKPKLFILLFLVCVLTLTACTKPADDAVRAGISDVEDDSTQEGSDVSETDEMMEEMDAVLEGDSDEESMGDGSVESEGMEDGSMETSEDSMDVEYETVPINKETSSFEFEGFGPGKSHVGTFTDWSGNMFVKEGSIIGGEGTIQVSSVDTGIVRLDAHLLNEDFFESETYPTIEFSSMTIDDESVMAGDLTFKGVTKEVTFPVVVSDGSITADFVLDTEPFGMSYTGVNSEVRIAFTFSE